MESLSKKTHATSRRTTIRAWLAGLLLISGLIVTVTHFSEIEHFVQLLKQAEPLWLILALVFQSGTYFSVAAVWHQALKFGGLPYPFFLWCPLGWQSCFQTRPCQAPA